MLSTFIKTFRNAFPKLISIYLALYLTTSPLLVLSTAYADEGLVEQAPVVTQEETPVVEPVVEQPEPIVQTPTPKPEVEQVPKPVEKPTPVVKEVDKSVEVIVADSGTGALNTIVENVLYDCNASSAISCVNTDKPDYSPVDVVTLNGYSYLPNEEYTLAIYSENNPAVRHEVTVTTDANGEFVHKYQLDGTYRPQYYVEVKNKLGEVVANGSFTDGRLIGSATLNGSSTVNVAPSTVVTVSMSVATSGSSNDDDWKSTSYKIGNASTQCVDHSDSNGDGNYIKTFDITAPNSVGSYDVKLIAYEDNNCNTGASTSKTLTNGIVVSQPQEVQPSANPTLSQSCGIDIGLIIDTSTSIDNTELSQMKSAMNAFVTAFSGTPTQMAVVSFDDSAVVQSGFTSNLANLNSVINGIDGSGYTNWEDALNDTRVLFPNRNDKPDLIVFTSDGNPTVSNEDSDTNLNQPNQHLSPAIVQANLAKAAGIRVITLGIGDELSAANLQSVSSADAYYSAANFGALTTTLQQLASDLCGGTITVNKYLGSVSENNRASTGWTFNVAGTSRTTNAQGQTTPVEVNNQTPVSVVETDLVSGYSFTSAVCKNQNNQVVGSSITNGVGNIVVGNSEIITCDVVNTLSQTDLKITKSDNADPIVNGGTLTYTILVENLTSVPAQNTVVTDNLPSGFTPTLVTPSVGSCSDTIAPTISCELGTIGAGASATVTITGTVNTSATSITNSASVVTNTSETNYNNNSDDETTNIVQTGSLKVNKRVDLNGDGDWNDTNETSNSYASSLGFTWTLDGVGSNAMGTTKSGVSAGDHTISENNVADYHFVSWYVTGAQGKSCTNPNGTTLPVTRTVVSNQTNEITLCNGKDLGTVTIIKDAVNNDNQDFRFDTNLPGENGDFYLEDDGNNNDGNKNYLTKIVPAGSYWVDERNVDGWKLTSLVCTGDNNTTSNLEDGKVIFNVQNGENITCTYTNTKLGKIEGIKYYDRDGDKNYDEGEEKLSGWQIFIDLDNDGEYDDGEPTELTSGDSFKYVQSFYFHNQNNGEYEFDNLLPGTYKVCEVLKDGWYNSTPICQTTVITPGDDDTVNFGNYQPLIINASKVVCNSESDLPNWANGGPNVTSSTALNYVNTHPNCKLESGWDFQWGFDGKVSNYSVGDQTGLAPAPWATLGTTDINGSVNFALTEIAQGANKLNNLWVRENLKPGYVTFSNSSQDSYSAEIYCHIDGLYYDNYDRIDNPQFGQTYYCVAFNAKKTGTITVTKDVLDPNGNQIVDTSHDFAIEVDESDTKYVTDGQTVIYENLPVGTYTVTEGLNGDYTFDHFSTDADTELNGAQVTVTEGQTTNVTVFNRQKTGKIIVTKEVVDAQGNDEATSEQEFEIVLGEQTEVISDNGESSKVAQFEDLNPGSYTFNETSTSGFIFNGCYRTDRIEKELDTFESNDVQTILASNETQHWTCINRAVEANLNLVKSNNKTGLDLLAGDSVTYTLVVTAPTDNVSEEATLVVVDTPYILNDVKVADVAPKGFNYVNGSWTAYSNIRGLLTIPQPTYSTVGIWELGDMIEGEVVTLTYIANISSDQDAGLYKDLAWTQGTDVLGNRVIGSAPMGSFAGTEINVVEKFEEGKAQVLGISLPNTGAQMIWPVLALISFISGLIMIAFGLSKRKKVTGVLASALIIVGAISLINPNSAYASTGLSVRVEQPKTLFNKESMKLGFVALDIDGRPVAAQCEQKGPGDASFSNVGSILNLGNGGSNGDCVINSSVLDTDGVYEFRVTATAGADSLSETVSMTLDTNNPGPVVDYEKTKGVCTYVLKFKTANDGQTTKVQIFRSTEKTFIANASTLVTEISTSSNDSVEYTDTLPDCDKEYFYAVRALDTASNTSPFIADSIAVVSEETNTDGSSNGNSNGGEVKGSDDKDNDGDNGTDGGEVKGDDDAKTGDEEAKNNFQNNVSWNWIIGIILAAAILWILERTGILQKVFQKVMSWRRK